MTTNILNKIDSQIELYVKELMVSGEIQLAGQSMLLISLYVFVLFPIENIVHRRVVCKFNCAASKGWK